MKISSLRGLPGSLKVRLTKAAANKTPLFLPAFAAALLFLGLAGCSSVGHNAKVVHDIRRYEVSTNRWGFVASHMIYHEHWLDHEHDAGHFLLADPEASRIIQTHVNQQALGGRSGLAIGTIKATVSTNALREVGDAVGTIGGDVVEAIKKVP